MDAAAVSIVGVVFKQVASNSIVIPAKAGTQCDRTVARPGPSLSRGVTGASAINDHAIGFAPLPTEAPPDGCHDLAAALPMAIRPDLHSRRGLARHRRG